MEPVDPLFGSPEGVFVDHVPFQGDSLLQTTINPRDVLLTQPPRMVAHPQGNTQNIVTTYDVRYSSMGNVPQETVYHVPAWPATHPRCPFLNINDDFTVPFTGAIRSVRRIYRKSCVDNTVSMPCQSVSKPCQWQPQGSSICGQDISGPSVPKHLAIHGIQNMRRDCVAQCCWSGCGVHIRRQGMTRHLREVHLGLKRKSCVDAPV